MEEEKQFAVTSNTTYYFIMNIINIAKYCQYIYSYSYKIRNTEILKYLLSL